MRSRPLFAATLLAALFGLQLLFSAGALANTDTGEETDPANNHTSYLVVTSPTPHSSVAAGTRLKISIRMNKPFDGYNGVDVAIAPASKIRPSQSYQLTGKIKYLPAALQKDGTYLATYAIPADYSGPLWLMPEDIGDGLFNARAGHYVLIDVQPPK